MTGYKQIKGKLDDKLLDEIVSMGEMDRIQCVFMPCKEDIIALNERYFSLFPHTCFRLYTLRGINTDLSNLQYLTNVEKINIQTSEDVSNLDVFLELTKLKEVWLTIDKRSDFEFIKMLPESLEFLYLDTKSTSFDLTNLLRFQSLKTLHLLKYKKNLDIIGELSTLERLSLRGISHKSYAFINKLKHLHSLSITWCTKEDLSELYGNTSITALRLFRISNLDNVEIIANLPNLEAAHLSWLRHVDKLPDLSKHQKLKHILLDNTKALKDLSGLEHLCSLETLSYPFCPSIFEPNDALPILRNPSLKSCGFGILSDKKRTAIASLIAKYGKINKIDYDVISKAFK